MEIEKAVEERSGAACELCGSKENMTVYPVPPVSDMNADNCLHICGICSEQIGDPGKTDPNHWHCLNESMWSEVPAVQVMAFRMLRRLSAQSWASDLMDMLYLEEDVKAWAEAVEPEDGSVSNTVVHKDSNGAILEAGDTITLIMDLNVKGAGFTAKRGTAVRDITLVEDNAGHIEGRVNGQRIVLLTKFVKKSK